MRDYASIGPVATLAAGTVAPLVLTLAPAEPGALVAGIILAGVLTRLTFDPSGPKPTSFDAKKESAAVRDVSLTSSGNRVTRLLLGSVYAYAAATFAMRMAKAEPGEARLLARVLTLEPAAVGKLAAAWFGSFTDLLIAGLWLSSGADGQ